MTLSVWIVNIEEIFLSQQKQLCLTYMGTMMTSCLIGCGTIERIPFSVKSCFLTSSCSPLSPLTSNPLALLSVTGVFWEDFWGGQHLLAWHEGSSWVGSRGQAMAQSSEADIDAASMLSTNSGWIVVEWMPSLWKNSFTFSAIWEKKREIASCNRRVLPKC